MRLSFPTTAPLLRLREHLQERHITICIKEHSELLQKEAMIQEQSRQLREKEAVIHQLAAACGELKAELQEKRSKFAELKDKVATLSQKNERLRMGR